MAAERGEGLQALLARAAAEILAHEDPLAFERWLVADGARALADLGLDGVAPEAARSFLGLLARSIWNATPLPSHGFRPLPRPLPRGDEPCLCGSGRAFEGCCGLLPPFPPIPEVAVWEALAEDGPLEPLTQAAQEGVVPGSVLGRLALRLEGEGQAERALTLLRAALGPDRQPDASYEHALDTLVDLTTALRGAAARDALVQELLRRLEPPLRGAVWGCRGSLAAEAGDLAGAWADLERGRRDDPDSPGLAALELNLLSAEGRLDELQARARFWRARFDEHAEAGDLDEFLELLDQVVEDPRALARERQADGCGGGAGGSIG